mgnify:FL=1
MICDVHKRFIPEGQVCSNCFSEQHKARQAEAKKAGKTFGRHRQFEKSKKSKKRDNLKSRLQGLVSQYVKSIYREKGVYFDWITNKPNNRTGLFGLHAAHYYPKGELWQLWCDPVNIGLTGYNQNVNKPETAPMMRDMMIKVWGEETVNDLDKRSKEADERIKAGIDPRYPTDLWLIGMIAEMKTKIKALK